MRRYFIAGLLLWLPLLVTYWLIKFMVDVLDRVFNLLPLHYQPEHLIGFYVPGLGLIFVLLVLFITGLLVTNFIGDKLVGWWEKLLSRIPLVRAIYNGIKQVTETLLSTSGDSFRNVVMIEYPRKGIWSIAFQTSHGFHHGEKAVGKDLLTVFVPTTPNPTSGFFMLVPKDDAIILDIKIDEALKMIISLGVVLPKKPE